MHPILLVARNASQGAQQMRDLDYDILQNQKEDIIATEFFYCSSEQVTACTACLDFCPLIALAGEPLIALVGDGSVFTKSMQSRWQSLRKRIPKDYLPWSNSFEVVARDSLSHSIPVQLTSFSTKSTPNLITFSENDNCDYSSTKSSTNPCRRLLH